MSVLISRVLTGLAAAALAIDASLHWIFFGQSALAAVGASNLPLTLMADFKVLWVADVTTLLSLAAVFAWAAISPASVAPAVVLVLSVIPAALGILVFLFGAPSYAGVNMLIAAALAAAGAMIKARAPAQANA
jgi:hypothetical protein